MVSMTCVGSSDVFVTELLLGSQYSHRRLKIGLMSLPFSGHERLRSFTVEIKRTIMFHELQRHVPHTVESFHASERCLSCVILFIDKVGS